MKTIKILGLALLLLAGLGVQAQVAPIDEQGLAVGGYDVVAYFSGEAQKGDAAYSVVHEEVTYHFVSEDNKATFQAEPAKFLPQFDGYCAWGVAEQESKFPINPETFDIVDGKLYLFFNGPFNGEKVNTLLPWNAETSKLSKAAHENWSKMNNP